VLPDGGTIYDSGIIIEYLQDVAGTDRLLPLKGRERYRALTLSRLADGIMDASILVVYENRFRPDAATHSPRWLAHQRGKITRGLMAFEKSPSRLEEKRCRHDRTVVRARLSRLAQASRLAASLSRPGRVAERILHARARF
jgi:glutathione S-transferase